MKLITWNCNGTFRKKNHLFDDYDILIVQECENPLEYTKSYKD